MSLEQESVTLEESVYGPCGRFHCPKQPWLMPDCRATRQYWYQVLQLPGENRPRFFTKITFALHAAKQNGHTTVELCAHGLHASINLDPQET